MNENEIIVKRKKDLRDFLELMDDQAENGPEGYILANGTVFVGRQSSKSIKELYFKPKKGEIHYNSQQLSILKQLRYFEGYAMHTTFPMVHAWSVADNKVIDITYEMWEEDNNIDIGNTCVYFGVEIPVDFVWKNQQETHMAEPVLLKYLHSI